MSRQEKIVRSMLDLIRRGNLRGFLALAEKAEPADLGKPEKATYTCESCSRVFSYEEAQEFLNKPPAVLASVSRDDDRS